MRLPIHPPPNTTKDKVNVTLDLMRIGAVNEIESTFKVKMGWSTYWLDPWWKYIGLEAVFNGSIRVPRSLSTSLLNVVDNCITYNVDGTSAQAPMCVISTDTTTGCASFYSQKDSGLPALTFYNVDAMDSGIGPAPKYKFYSSPATGLEKPIRYMGGGAELEKGRCAAGDGWAGCPFNMAVVSPVSKVTFKNFGWDISWYPFDTRTFKIKLMTHHDKHFDYSFPEMPKKVKFDAASGWAPTGHMTCQRTNDVSNPDFLRDVPGFVCSVPAARQWANPLFTVCLPLFLSITTVWITFYAPVGAAMPRVAVTALAYVTMGSSFNALYAQLPAGGDMCWLQYLVLIQLLVCVEGTSCHLLLFMYADSKQPHMVRLLNRIMMWYVPLSYLCSFLVASITVLNVTTGLVLVALLAMVPMVLPHLLSVGSVGGGDESSSTAEALPGKGESAVGVAVGPAQEPDTEDGDVGGNMELAIRRLDKADFGELFQRYDLDESGYIDSREELTQLTMATIYRLGLDKENLAQINLVANVDLKVNEAFEAATKDGVIWSETQAKEWIAREFV